MYYFLYETRNLINNKIYVGVHKTQQLNDGYIGSGSRFTAAVKKYGKSNFHMIIIEYFTSETEMYEREREIVNDSFLARPDVYNIKLGGSGGWDYINSNGLSVDIRVQHENDPTIPGRIRDTLRKNNSGVEFDTVAREKGRKIVIENSLGYLDPEVRKKAHEMSKTAEAMINQKESFKKIGHMQGEKNSQFGTIWITNGEFNKKIEKDSVIPTGWRKGRIIKRSNS